MCHELPSHCPLACLRSLRRWGADLLLLTVTEIASEIAPPACRVTAHDMAQRRSVQQVLSPSSYPTPYRPASLPTDMPAPALGWRSTSPLCAPCLRQVRLQLRRLAVALLAACGAYYQLLGRGARPPTLMTALLFAPRWAERWVQAATFAARCSPGLP